MKRVFLLSPLAPIFPSTPASVAVEPLFTFESNVAFAKRCAMNSIARGEAPFGSHLLYPFVGLDDFDPRERRMGIECGLAWLAASEVIAVYTDRGISKGMRQELAEAKARWQEIEDSGGPKRVEELLYEGDFSRAGQSILDLRRRADFRRLDGGPSLSWQGLHDLDVPHLTDVDGRKCPICFGPAPTVTR